MKRLHVIRRLIWFIVVATFAVSSSYAQDISGDWQGSLKAGPQDLRIILKVTRADSGEWKATMLSIDQSPDRGTGMVTTLNQPLRREAPSPSAGGDARNPVDGRKRRYLVVAVRSGEGPLTEHITATQAQPPERVFMPQTRH